MAPPRKGANKRKNQSQDDDALQEQLQDESDSEATIMAPPRKVANKRKNQSQVAQDNDGQEQLQDESQEGNFLPEEVPLEECPSAVSVDLAYKHAEDLNAMKQTLFSNVSGFDGKACQLSNIQLLQNEVQTLKDEKLELKEVVRGHNKEMAKLEKILCEVKDGYAALIVEVANVAQKFSNN